MSKASLIVASLLAILACSAIATTTASARKAGTWLCVKVATNRGSWNDADCGNVAVPFNRAWAYFNPAGEIWACERGGLRFGDSSCFTMNAGGPFAWFKWGPLVAGRGKLGATKIKGTVAKKAITIECTGGKSTTGALDGQGLEEGSKEVLSKENVLTYEGCGASEKCEVKNFTTTKLKGKETTEKRAEETLSPETGTTIAEIQLKKCAAEGTYKLTGSQTCEWDKSNAEAKEAKEAHSLVCKPAGSSKLELAGSKAEYEGTDADTLEVENAEEKATEVAHYAIEE